MDLNVVFLQLNLFIGVNAACRLYFSLYLHEFSISHKPNCFVINDLSAQSTLVRFTMICNEGFQ